MAARRSGNRDVDYDFYSVQENSGNNSNVPAFLMKLWTLVEDTSNDEIICWDPKGKSFHIYDQSHFAHEVLPFYFKHNNISSFIRQLNMYGFRKVVKVEQGGLKVERDDLEFQHAYFQRGEEQLLEYIKRRSAPMKTEPRAMSINPDEVSKVLSDVTQMKSKQDMINSSMAKLQRENEALWREVAILRQKHAKQQQIVHKLLQFLVSLMNPGRGMAGLQRKRPLMINNTPEFSDTPGLSPPKMPNIRLDSSGDHDYTVQSPSEMQKASTVPTSNSTVVIQELLEPVEPKPGTISLPTSANISSPLNRNTTSSSGLVSFLDPSVLSSSTSVLPSSSTSSFPTDKSLSLLDQAALSANVIPQSFLTPAQTPQPSTSPKPAQQKKQQEPSKQIALRSTTDQPLSAAAAPISSPRDMTDQLDLIQAEIESLQNKLTTSQFTLDPTFIKGLFNSPASLPVQVDPSFLDTLMAEGESSEQETSTSAALPVTPTSGNITGQELWQYQPQEYLPDLFDTLEDEKPQIEDDMDDNLQVFFENKDSLNTPVTDPPNNFLASDTPGLSITADELD